MNSIREKRPREEGSHSESSRPRKRPGAASRISRAEADAVQQRQQQRAEEAKAFAASRGNEEAVRQHYNAVPQRGREWRKTDSRIKGLRSFNNWVKSTIIHKFSPSEPGSEPLPLRVLDVGCGKGGDLGKWQQAPQAVELYVGIDPAEVSIEQARERYQQLRSGGGRGGRGRGGYHGGRPPRTFDAEFIAEDAFSYSLGDLPIIREVGFGPGSRWGPTGGFDVVSMMFCMHYAFETEAKAKGMLANVAGSLKKGGRFIGVIPNSDVLREGVEAFHQRQAKMKQQEKDIKKAENGVSCNGKPRDENLPAEGETKGSDETATSTKKRKATRSPEVEPAAKRTGHLDDSGLKADETAAINGLTEPAPDMPVARDDAVKITSDSKAREHAIPETSTKSESAGKATDRTDSNIESTSKAGAITETQVAEAAVAEWGNSLYRVRFPGDTPKDGIFRPPYGWKYSFFIEEAVEEVPEYVVPWEAFRAYYPPFSPTRLKSPR